jgi:hypothetical protein
MTPEESNRIIVAAIAAAAQATTVWVVTRAWWEHGEQFFEVVGVHRAEEQALQAVGANAYEYRLHEAQVQ